MTATSTYFQIPSSLLRIPLLGFELLGSGSFLLSSLSSHRQKHIEINSPQRETADLGCPYLDHQLLFVFCGLSGESGIIRAETVGLVSV